jgi:O-antigen/teichoic acid export membrane protein
MSAQAETIVKTDPAATAATVACDADLTGGNRLTWNVIASWGGQLLVIVCGFIMPRMIDRHVGQVSLGIWDFCWSIVSYFGLAGLGIGSSVNRHVAMYRASHQPEKLRAAVSSVNAIQIVVSLLIVAMAALVAGVMPLVFSARLGSHMSEARWIVMLLGGSLAVQMAFDCYRGVMTGCHRWDLHNALNAGSYGLTVLGMIVALMLGGRLRSIGTVYLAANVVTEILRVIAAHRICPGLTVNPRYATRADARHMFGFGAKAILASVSPLVLQQSASLIVGACLGPAALAVFARPSNLIRNAQAFLNKFAFVLTPMASSLQGSGRSKELGAFLLSSSRWGAAMTIPAMLTMALYSDLILGVWMGSRYQGGAIVMVILAAAYTMPLAQQSALSILVGLDRHGRIGVLTLALSVVALGAGIVVFHWLGWSLAATAMLAGIPLTLSGGIVLPVYACKQLDVGVRKYFVNTFASPLLCAVPYGCVLLLARRWFSGPWMLLVGPFVAGLAMAPFYWYFILSDEMRRRIAKKLRRGTVSRRQVLGATGGCE